MCRISAIVSNNKTSLHQIKLMNDAMQKGGPDGEGILIDEDRGYAIGHRRLSIIDLSNAASQPMVSENYNLEITFNGEIYNFKELREELEINNYTFKTQSDTEVILLGYHFWKEKVLDKLRGMFAFVIIDKNANQIFAARDHAGIKPLYIGYHQNEIYFSSEIRGLKAINNNWKENDKWKIWFLTFGFLPEPITTLENVKPIPRGSYTIIDLKTRKELNKKYYEYSYNNLQDTYKNATKRVTQLTEQSVKRHLVSDVAVGVFLSGGIDSSILAILAQNQQKSPIETISIYFDDEKYSEKGYQDLIIKQTGVKHHFYKVTQQEFLDSWEDIYKSLDQPSTDAINTYFICKYAKQNGIKVVLSGLGADEIFGGYPSINRSLKYKQLKRIAILNTLVPNFLKTAYPNKKIDFLKYSLTASEYLLYRGLFTPKDVAKILGISTKEVLNELSNFSYQEKTDHLCSQNKAAYMETSIYMQSQLLKDSDMQSMWQGIELRVPFLDKDLVEYVNNLHTSLKFQDNKNKPKPLLVDAFINILPPKIWNRPKQGFTFPFENWFSNMNIFRNKAFMPEWIYHQFLTKKLNFSRLWGVFLAYNKDVSNSTENFN